jgi:hypothetical protein
MTIQQARQKWSGGSDKGGVAGFSSNTVITKEMANDPKFAVPFLKQMSIVEAGTSKGIATDEQLRQGFDMYRAGSRQAYYQGRGVQAPATPASPPAPQSAPTSSAPAPKQQLPTVQQVIKENINKPEFSQYSAYAGMIPDQNLPVDQWKQKHGDLYNNPMAAPFRSIFDKSMAQTPPATPATARGMPPQSFPPLPPPRPAQQQIAGQPQQPQFGYPPTSQQQLRAAQGPGYSPPQAQWPSATAPQSLPPMPQSAPQTMQQQAVNNIRPPQPGSTQQMPDFAQGTGGYNDEYGIHPPYPMPQQQTPAQPQMQPAPQPPPMQPGSPFPASNPIGGTDWALPSNRGMMPGNIQPGLSGGTPFPFSPSGGSGMGSMGMGDMGGMGFGGGGFGGGDAAGGGMGGGGKRGGGVNMQSAMALIPKPISLPSIQMQPEGGINPIKVQPSLPPNAGGSTNLAQTIMDFLQQGQQGA